MQGCFGPYGRYTNLGGYKLYLTLSSMGVSDGCSILDIINALPAKSLFLYHEQYNGATIKDMPPTTTMAE